MKGAEVNAAEQSLIETDFPRVIADAAAMAKQMLANVAPTDAKPVNVEPSTRKAPKTTVRKKNVLPEKQTAKKQKAHESVAALS